MLAAKLVMPLPFSEGEVRSVLLPLERAELLPASAYADPAVFELERTRVFERAWLCVGRASEVEAPGSFFLSPLTPEGVLVVRGQDLALRAFYNVCGHRGARLVAEEAGRTRAFVCPYHGYRYELSGALGAAPGTASLEGFCRAERPLVSVRVGTWKGFVFVSLAPEGPPLAEALAPVPAHLSRLYLESLALGRRASHEVKANWKLVVENFQESHHFPSVHPGLERLTPFERSSSFSGGGPWLGGKMALAEEAETVSEGGRRRGRPPIGGATEEERRLVHDYFCWPSLLFSVQPDYVLSYRIFPLSPTRTRVTADVYFHPAASTEGEGPRDVYAFWDVTNAEDRAICESQQLGLGSRGYRRGRYAESEDGVHAFDGRVARLYLEALGEPKGEEAK